MTDERMDGEAVSGSEDPAGPKAEASPPPAAAPGHRTKHSKTEETAMLKAEIERLEGELETARHAAESHLDDARRLKAEFDNYRKRVLKEQTALVDRASLDLVERLLPVLDNFELALIAATGSRDFDALARGVELVFGELLDVLHKEGLRKIEAEGKPFDPEKHEAVMQAEDAGDGEPHVVDVLRTGYEVRGKVVRPSMVKVGRRPKQ